MMQKYRLVYLTLIIIIALPLATLAIGLDVPATDPVYDFLKRLETRGVIRGLNDLALPLTRDEIVTFLQNAAQQTDKLSKIENSTLREFLADYRYETERQTSEQDSILAPFYLKHYFPKAFKRLFSRQNVIEENHLFMYENGATFLWFDIGARGRLDWKDNHQKQMFSDRYQLRGALGKSLTFHTYIARYMKKHNPAFSEPYDEEIGSFSVVQPSGTVTFDVLHSSLVYHNPYFNLGLYRQPISWGAGGINNLALTKTAPLFSYIGFNTQLKGIKLTFVHGALMNDSTHYRNIPMEVRNRAKYITAHRIDIPFFKGTTIIGFSEMVIYGDRGMEIPYLMPLGFFWPTGHALEDRDNTLMALDFKMSLIRNLTLYGSLLIDEMQFGQLGEEWWANKHALQIGLRLSPTIASFPVDIQAEYTAVRPWTYSHKTLTTNYTHNGICLGFPYGANSQAGFCQITTAFSRRLTVTSEFLYLRQGVDDDTHFWGGDPTVSYESRDRVYDQSTKWLMGDVQTTNQFKVIGCYELFNDFFIKSGISFDSAELKGNRASHRFGYLDLVVDF
ncbi:MAG: capsule assembly Wzi family protein [Candidatus Neomarinimicrobiota bacterium]